MVQTHPSQRAQLGFLAERPSPARIAAFSGVIAIHAAAFVLLLMPMAAPEPAPVREDVIPIVFQTKKPLVVPVTPERTETRRTPQRVTTRPIAPTPPQPPIVVEEGAELAPPIAPPAEDVAVIEPIPTGPLAMERLEYLSAPPPPYPPEAERRRIEGTVLLQVLVDVDGRPIEVLVQNSSGNRQLDDAARKHVLKKWKFRPAMRNGAAVQAIGLVPIKYTMR